MNGNGTDWRSHIKRVPDSGGTDETAGIVETKGVRVLETDAGHRDTKNERRPNLREP
jgi:hypothetical protein